MIYIRISTILFFIINCLLIAQCRRGHLEPLGNSGTIKPLHEKVGFIPPKEFLAEYVLKNRPVLMRKAFYDSPAIKLWTDEYLQKSAEEADADVTVEFGKKETRKNGSTLAFSKYLQMYNDTDVYMVSATPKNLEKDLIIPWSLQCEDYKRSFEDNVMWFSSGGTKSVIHHDGYENINCLIRGRKRFFFVNTTKYSDIEQEIIDIQQGSYGSVDVDKVDLDKYPFYEGMEFFKAEMNPGDCVYSPYLWIHQVESHDSNIAANVWWFRDVNSLIDTSKCSETFDHSRTFATAAFHRTTALEDGENYEDIIFATRHSYARFLFTSVNKAEVNAKEFLKLMGKCKKKITKDFAKMLVDFFRSLDVNKDRKFNMKDLTNKISKKSQNAIFDNIIQLVSIAKVRDCPIPLDLSDQSYLDVEAFHETELKAKSSDSDEDKPPHEGGDNGKRDEL